jgi:hypothetical protein
MRGGGVSVSWASGGGKWDDANGAGSAPFFSTGAWDFRARLPQPSAMGSLAAESDLAAVRQAQA